MSTRKPKQVRRYFPCTDVNDAMDAARCVGGALLYHEGEWRCYSQVNRLYLDFPELREPGALVRKQIGCLRGDGGLDNAQVILFMKDWSEPPTGVAGVTPKGTPYNPLGSAGVQALLDELDKHSRREP